MQALETKHLKHSITTVTPPIKPCKPCPTHTKLLCSPGVAHIGTLQSGSRPLDSTRQASAPAVLLWHCAGSIFCLRPGPGLEPTAGPELWHPDLPGSSLSQGTRGLHTLVVAGQPVTA